MLAAYASSSETWIRLKLENGFTSTILGATTIVFSPIYEQPHRRWNDLVFTGTIWVSRRCAVSCRIPSLLVRLETPTKIVVSVIKTSPPSSCPGAVMNRGVPVSQWPALKLSIIAVSSPVLERNPNRPTTVTLRPTTAGSWRNTESGWPFNAGSSTTSIADSFRIEMYSLCWFFARTRSMPSLSGLVELQLG